MAIINRAALKAQFRTGTMPHATDYYNLIDSMLVKKDDIFFGKWQPGISYRLDDVVIYKNALYCCITQGQDPCGCDEEGKEKQQAVVSPKGSFCSINPPDVDKENWQLLELEIADEDWTIIRAEKPAVDDIMYANVFGKIGMGTKTPAGKVHIHIKETNGDFLFSPDKAGVPEFQLRKGGDLPQALSVSIEENKANFSGNTEGFLFQPTGNITAPPENEQQQQQQQQTSTEKPAPVFITSVTNKPAIGVGTLTPGAAIALQEHQGKTLLLNPWNRTVPELLMTHRASGELSCLSVQVNEKNAQFTAKTAEGFLFKKGLSDCETYSKDGNDTGSQALVSIKPDGKVGIGTETPGALLEVTDGTSGRFLLSIKKTNPAFSVINTRPQGDPRNYLTIGADNESGVLITDSSRGFLFKKGREYGSDDNEVNINQGTTELLSIAPDGNVVIGDRAELQQCELDVLGVSRMFNLLIDSGAKRIKEKSEPMKSVLQRIKKLIPTKFYWKDKYTNDRSEQYGLITHEVEDYFPELVKESNKIKAIAYPNLVTVLLKALQEQQGLVEELESRVSKLESKVGK